MGKKDKKDKKNKFLNIFKNFNTIDLIILIIIIAGISILCFTAVGGFDTAANIEQNRKKIEIDVILKGERITKQEEIFKVGEKTFITIRNIPYTELEIIKSIQKQQKTIIPDPENPHKAIEVENPSLSNIYNFLVTLTDKAIITDDGAVVGGNKIKIGLPIILEGFDYRLSGVVSDIRIKEELNGKTE